MKHKITFAAQVLNIHQHIIKGIQQQLYLNDYLVLPNFGGFVLKTQGASFTGSGLSMLPPRKTLGFNVQLKQNDGILSQYLQHQLSCKATEANKHLEEFSVFCSSVLQSKRRLSLEGIGFFYLDFENNICFEPALDQNFLTDSFGLAALSIQALPVEETETKATPKVDRQAAQIAPAASVVKKTVRVKPVMYMAAILLLLATVFTLVLSRSTNVGLIQSALFYKNDKALYSPLNYPSLNLQNTVSEDKRLVADNNGIAMLKLSNDKQVAVSVFATDNSGANLNKAIGKYEIIFGCFKKLKNAKRLVAQLQKSHVEAGIKAETYKGMHVVALSGINDKVQAVDVLEALQNQYPKAWLKVN